MNQLKINRMCRITFSGMIRQDKKQISLAYKTSNESRSE